MKPFGDIIDILALVHIEADRNRTIPLGLISVNENGEAKVDDSAVLGEREQSFPVNISKPFKLNAGTTGVCACDLADC
jgi:hypothetical protein